MVLKEGVISEIMVLKEGVICPCGSKIIEKSAQHVFQLSVYLGYLNHDLCCVTNTVLFSKMK